MKKLMIVAMVAMAAVAANAANLKWGVSSGTVADFSTEKSAMMYLVWADTAPSFSSLAEMSSFGESTIASIGGTIVTSQAYTGGVSQPATSVVPGDPVESMPSGSHKFYNIIISDDGKEIAYSAAGSATILNNASSLSVAKAGTGFTVVQASAVPEPTSGLLLLLGVAGMALRRRRA